MAHIRLARWPDELAQICAIDTSFETDRIYRVQRSKWSFTIVESALASPLHKSFPLSDELRDSPGAWSRALVAESAGTIIGFAAVDVQAWNRRAILSHLYVARNHRGHGIGRALLQDCLSYAREQRCRCLWLEATSVNGPAIRFYLRAGFRLCGLDETLYDPDGPASGEIALFFAHNL